MSAEVVTLFPAQRSTFDAAWALLPALMRKRSDGKSKLKPMWDSHAKRVGPDELLSALQRYLKDDKDVPRTGGPGLQVWLRACRYEAWMVEEEQVSSIVQMPAIEFPDARLRAAFHLRFQDDKARRWFDRCTLEGDMLIWPSPPSLEWAEKMLKPWAILNGIGGWRSK